MTMLADVSPPTARVLDVLELVALRRNQPCRAADVARELGLSKATTHAIVHQLAKRGWLVRSTTDRYLSLGPALAPIASAFSEQRAVTRHAVRAAAGLASATGWAASVVELIGEVMYVSTVNPEDLSYVRGQRVAYAAPFGTLFAAWATPDERLAWLRRGRLNEAMIASYGAHLDTARSQGFLIERMSPVVQHATSLVQATNEGAFPEAVGQLAGELLDEVVQTSIGLSDGVGVEHPVTSIAAPVQRGQDAVTTALVVHPLCELNHRTARRAASMVRQAARAIPVDVGRSP